jgi:hypothetical protein
MKANPKARNNNCDGADCTVHDLVVRRYPIGGGSSLNLCRTCAAHENRFRFERGRDTGQPQNWPQVNWYQCEVVT